MIIMVPLPQGSKSIQVFVKVPLNVIAMMTIAITNALPMIVPDKVNKAGRMAEQCGRKGAKQQVDLREDEITMIMMVAMFIVIIVMKIMM